MKKSKEEKIKKSNFVDKKHSSTKKSIVMGKYYFNTKLFVSLRSILGVSTEDMALAAENSTHRVRAWTREGDVPLYALIGICNEYHIPIRHFIVTEEDPEVILSRQR